MAEEAGQDAEDRTEEPTSRRIEKAREEGQAAQSKEVAGLAALGGGALALAFVLPPLGRDLAQGMRGVLEQSHALAWPGVAAELARLGAFAVLPVAALAGVAALAATLLQTRFLVSAKPLQPQLSRISPLAGAKRLASPESLFELLRTLIKLGVVGGALWWAVGDPAALRAVLADGAGGLLAALEDAALRLIVAALVAYAFVAGADLLWVRFRHLRRLRMSRQDLREELRESEGDPQLKARQRQIRLQRARRRMMAAVPKAAVVITNPTHYAVALAYEKDTSAAPRLVAKGADAVAARIRAVAEEARVPIVANPPLARALYQLELDAEIPAEHYQAVAEIIAFVWGLRPRPG
jgi:flagellar biosynthetic protein FlhB